MRSFHAGHTIHVRARLVVTLLLATTYAGCKSVASVVDVITPIEMTHTAIDETFVRVDLYAKQHGAIPPSLAVLPQRSGYMNRTTDGWKRPLLYDIRNDGCVTLTSYGKDRKPGGVGEDADISRSYRAKRPDGSLWAGVDGLWIVNAEVRQPATGKSERQVKYPDAE
jgi:hypothetical protein